MVAVTYDTEIASCIPAEKLFKAFILDGDTLIPKVMPGTIKSVEILEGDGGAGSVKLTTFAEGAHLKTIKQKVDSLDKDNLTYSYTIADGAALGSALESINYHVKIVPSADGGSICKNRSIYNTKGDAQISEEQIKGGKEKASEILKALEAYLKANPDAC